MLGTAQILRLSFPDLLRDRQSTRASCFSATGRRRANREDRSTEGGRRNITSGKRRGRKERKTRREKAGKRDGKVPPLHNCNEIRLLSTLFHRPSISNDAVEISNLRWNVHIETWLRRLRHNDTHCLRGFLCWSFRTVRCLAQLSWGEDEDFRLTHRT